jgi:surfactin synthase thioesterase subunit
MNDLRGNTKDVYLFPGQGADKRLFSKIAFDSTFNVNYITYPIPGKNETLEQYSARFISQIDTTRTFILIGVSMGGMICTELHDKIKPEKTIVISSAKSYHELPKKYTIQRKLRLNRIIPGRLLNFLLRF